jgi:hypothetical protein
MDIRLKAHRAVALILTAGLIVSIDPQAEKASTVEPQVRIAEIVKTEDSQTEAILQSDGTWRFEVDAFNDHRRSRLPFKILIPEEYVGWVNIRYGLKHAPPLRIEEGYIVARIPQSGILETSSLIGIVNEDTGNGGGAYNYVGRKVTPIKRQKIGGWIGPQPEQLSEQERTLLGDSHTSDGGGVETVEFFVGSAAQFREFAKNRSPAPGSFTPLTTEDGRYNIDPSPDGAFLTNEDTQYAYTKTGRKVVLNIDAQNQQTWVYAEKTPEPLDLSALSAELSESIQEATVLLETRQYHRFWRRFNNPYLRNTGYEAPRPKENPIDSVKAWSDLLGQQEFNRMIEGVGKDLLQFLKKIRAVAPVFSRVEYSKNLKASFYDPSAKTTDGRDELLSAPFIRVGGTWYIFFR